MGLMRQEAQDPRRGATRSSVHTPAPLAPHAAGLQSIPTGRRGQPRKVLTHFQALNAPSAPIPTAPTAPPSGPHCRHSPRSPLTAPRVWGPGPYLKASSAQEGGGFIPLSQALRDSSRCRNPAPPPATLGPGPTPYFLQGPGAGIQGRG